MPDGTMLRYATRGERIAAFAVDASLFLLAFLLGAGVQITALAIYQSRLGTGNFPTWPIMFSHFWNLGLTALTATEIRRGQTVGKWCLKLCVLGPQAKVVSTSAFATRWLVKYLPLHAWWVCIFVPVVNQFGLFIFCAVAAGSLVSGLLIFGPRRQPFHDRLAMTIVWKRGSIGSRFEPVLSVQVKA